jgi:hypothetical protein
MIPSTSNTDAHSTHGPSLKTSQLRCDTWDTALGAVSTDCHDREPHARLLEGMCANCQALSGRRRTRSARYTRGAMSLLMSAVVLYAVTVVYLFIRGVGVRQVAAIVASGIGSGLLLGIVGFVLLPFGAAASIAVFSMVMLILSAAHMAREQVLGQITPLGIVFLNIAATMAPGYGPLPLSFAWLAALIPVPYGPLRVALNLLILYWPSLLALAALRRGPPGHPWVRLLLGFWVCYVGIAAVAGPGWSVASQFRLDQPSQWLACFAAAFAAIHVAMLGLNFLLALTGKDEAATVSIARSVRIDDMALWRASAFGAAFWVAAYVLARLPLRFDHSGIVIAAAFVLGMLLERRGAAGAAATAAPPDDAAAMKGTHNFLFVAAFLLVTAGIAVLAWMYQSSQQRAWTSHRAFMDGTAFDMELVLLASGSLALIAFAILACTFYDGLSHRRAPRLLVIAALLMFFVGYRFVTTPLSPAWQPASSAEPRASAPQTRFAPSATGQQPEMRPAPGLFLRDENPAHHADLRKRLDAASVPYKVGHYRGGKEYLHVGEEHRSAAQQVLAAIEGPPLPFNRSVQFNDAAQQQAFTQWLTKKGVKWEILTKRYEQYVAWDAVPGHECLTTAFSYSKRAPWLGVDYYAQASMRSTAHCELELMQRAAFETPAHRDEFLAWLKNAGLKAVLAVHHGHEFVEWQSPKNDVLREYISQRRATCFNEHYARRLEAERARQPPPAAAAC